MRNSIMIRTSLYSEYNNEPVLYCKNCLSLKIRNAFVDHDKGFDYCDLCGSTDIVSSSFKEWEDLYIAKYGKKFLEIVEDEF